MRANVADDLVDGSEFKLTLLGFDELPRDWELDGVGVVRLEAGQHLGHFLGDEDTVVDLSPEHQKRPSIDQEGVLGAFLDQLRNGLGLRERDGSGGGQDE